jgi:chorismate mutase-like protein
MDLGDWRSRISELDNQILNLLNQRAEAALRIGDLKRRQDAPSYVPEREAAILGRLTAANRGPLAAEAVAAVWREILSACRALEGPVTVAYLGPQATFTHQAARERFGAAGTGALYSRTGRPLLQDPEPALARLRAAVEELADRPLAELCDGVIERLRPEGLQDDVALVALRLHPENRPRPSEAGPERLVPGPVGA